MGGRIRPCRPEDLTPSARIQRSSPYISSNRVTSSPEISDALINFVTQSDALCEPPHKRQKLTVEDSAVKAQQGLVGREQELDHITVKDSTWEIACSGSKLSRLETPVARDNVTALVIGIDQPEFVTLVDDMRNELFTIRAPEDKEGLEDAFIALAVHKEMNKWAKGEGRYWTEIGVVLFQRNGKDYVRLVFTIKWNITTSPDQVPHVHKKTPVLECLLSTYFHDPNVSNSDAWSLQDLYQSVHIPEKNDELSASMETHEIDLTLFPFQKRAVQWLLRKEGAEWAGRRVQDAPKTAQHNLPSSFTQIKDARGRSCFVSQLFGLVTLDVEPFTTAERVLKGGILAEEMGLGKTIEMIALMTLHKRPQSSSPTVFDPYICEHVRATSATLIVTPPSILQQWISEVQQHAPQMKVTHYHGIKGHGEEDVCELINKLMESDVVITTYSVLAAEINFTALNPEKSLRKKPRYPRKKSPLMQLSWWRVIMDEAQMIDSGVSNAAIVARLVPRINAWCVTGTPVRNDVNDLLGLLIFLRFEPFASIKHIWQSLITSNKHEFRKIFSWLALRHSKQNVRDELRLPAQRRYVITMPFTMIEQHYYRGLFNQMCEESGLNIAGKAIVEGWEPDEHAETMRKWLVRLRQAALHPNIGGRHRRAMGHREMQLRTVDEVLDAMVEEADVTIRAHQRALLTLKLKRGQLDENSPRVREALAIWTEVAREASDIVDEGREQLRCEIEKSLDERKASSTMDGKVLSPGKRDVSSYDSEASNGEEDNDNSSQIGVLRNRLRVALKIEHTAVFFRTNAYYQIKTNEEMTQPDSPEFRELERLEAEGYELAQKLRQEILQEAFKKANKLMHLTHKNAKTESFIRIPPFPSDPPKGALESRRVMEQLDTLAESLDAQANVLDEWRQKAIESLLQPLVDQDEGVVVTGDEYEKSTKTQDEVMVYAQALRAATSDRHDALTGLDNSLNKNDCNLALNLANKGGGAFPERTIELLNARMKIKPTKNMGSLRGILTDLRGLAAHLKANAEDGDLKSQNELAIVQKQLIFVQKLFSEQMQVTTTLGKEVEFFKSTMNARLEYYRQLQQVSDTLAAYEGPVNEAVRTRILDSEAALVGKLVNAKSARRYLDHLRREAKNPQDQRMCIVCRDDFEVGFLTVCGHQYCKHCIQLWLQRNHTCPACKGRLTLLDMYPISYKPQKLSIQAEEVQEAPQERSSPSSASRKSAIYSEISESKLAEIKKVDLVGPSFTTKIATLARHLIWLRETDPGAKSIIYSQFKEFLDELALAFEILRIGCSSIDKSSGIEKFKKDPSIECFLLHARAHASGLNLVNASHVFLCEPLINTALELQAIARVDRIGQQQETTVWLYLVDDTVEESIYQLSVKRRMEHIGKTISSKRQMTGKGKAKELTAEELLDTNLEEANSMELQHARRSGLLEKGGKNGEMVEKEDLWTCLFGGADSKKNNTSTAIGQQGLGSDAEPRGHEAGEAADEGRVYGNARSDRA